MKSTRSISRLVRLLTCVVAGWLGLGSVTGEETARELFERGLAAQSSAATGSGDSTTGSKSTAASSTASRNAALDQAEEFYLQALKLDDKSAATFNNLAQVYIQQQRPGKAEEAFRAAVRLGGAKRGFYAENYGAFQAGRGEWKSACRLYADAAAAQPDDNAAHDLVVDTCLKINRSWLGGYLWEMLDQGRVLQAQRCALEAIPGAPWSEKGEAELLAVVAASLGRQRYDLKEVDSVPVFRELEELSADAQVGAGAREILELHRGTWPAERPFAWWAARGPAYRLDRGLWPSQAFQQLALAVGRRLEMQQNDAADKMAGRLYQDILILGDRRPNPDVLLQLVQLYFRTDQREKLQALVREHRPAIMSAKGEAISTHQKQQAFEFHAALGLIYSKIGPLGDSQQVASAIYQLEHAVKLTGYEAAPTDDTQPALTPRLVNLLASAYEESGQQDKAQALQNRALKAFQKTGDIIAIEQVQAGSGLKNK